MATRTISTYQPAVACDVCGRNLLRGEQPDVFLAAGQRRMVCELCRARATHEGWMREADGHPVVVAATRGRRGRTFMGRLRPRRVARDDAAFAADEDAYGVVDPAYGVDAEYPVDDAAVYAGDPAPEPAAEGLEPEPGDDEWLVAPDAPRVVAAEPARLPTRGRASRAAEIAETDVARPTRSVHAVPTNADFKAARALEVFNVSEHPRRVAGVARSLGLPEVTARPITPDSTVMTIVVAWELCWYRYEVDLGDERSGVRLVSEGSELDELDALDRAANATADDRGELRMLAL